MNRQQAIGLLLQPPLSLLVLTIRTMPIAARTSDPVLMVALTARKDHMPQLARATALNRAEHFALLKCNFVVTLTKKHAAMLPQTIGDGRHVGEEMRTISPEPAPRRRCPPVVSVADDETDR